MSKGRSKSSARWLAEHESDAYVQLARKLGFRSRAVFKLQEINERDKILKAGMTVVDLGAAPGGWSQYARPQLGKNGRLIALDILAMAPLPEVEFILGDFREAEVLEKLETLAPPNSVDLVLSDMAPNISGIDSADQAASIYLCELALEFALQRLKPGGAFVVKLFQGEGSEAFLKLVRSRFSTVQVRKPKASRSRSAEVYLLARNHRLV
ncbi:MAG: 23S rRNA (uridine(2552)-2'-O)-methyltransferase RlmE [Nevskia sp.]|nr:23S rRNA (uridine(2552)-2'-O)-methyltransferase RlmE [Nevskia sp.]